MDTRGGPNRLLSRLTENELILRSFNRSTLRRQHEHPITPASEWLVDNFYLLEEQIQMARRHLPRGYSRELPRLASGPSAGFPRVYDIVLELIAHVDAQIDASNLRSYVAAYQSVQTLRLGELWAIPIMVRLGLIENLQRVSTRLVRARDQRDLASLWVARLQHVAESNPSELVVIVADMARSTIPPTSPFVTEFCHGLSRSSPSLQLARTWLEQRLAEHGLSIELLVQLESRNQAADQVSVSHSITSLRFLSAMDWRDFVEDLSVVEHSLRRDPASVYARMDFATRDSYRHAVEFFARHGAMDEEQVADEAIRLSAEGCLLHAIEDRRAHVGYYLIAEGEGLLGRTVRLRRPWGQWIERTIRAFPLTWYAGGISLSTVALTVVFARREEFALVPVSAFVPLVGVFLLGSSQLAVSMVNWVSMLLVPPRRLPRLDFTHGIAPEGRTMVVVPTMLDTVEGIDRLIESLEIHALANRDPHLHFALLTDFQDADAETLPEDAGRVAQVRAGIERLNQHATADEPPRFFLFHRPRRWNASEQQWIGYERKRGKLAQFNELLRGGAVGAFSEVVGPIGILSSIRYVITLDTDTQLPRETARRLVATMMHPLNRPVFDPVSGIVSDGYAILQPRVSVSLAGSRRSLFVRLLAGDVGIDPYTREVSDVYQDLFQEGSFIGKGIYDVDAFQRALSGRCPDNMVLSHDLLEACHARSALVSDVELYEAFPTRYNVDVARRHRWIRGDWQILPWLQRRVPGMEAGCTANPLSALSQWKILDNLRRSVVPMALLGLFLGLGFTQAVPAMAGPAVLVALIGMPSLLAFVVGLLHKPLDQRWGMHLYDSGRSLGRQACQVVLTVAFLPHDAFISLDAIVRTLARMWVTRRNLLEWQTSGASGRSSRLGLLGFHRDLWMCPGVAMLLLGGVLTGGVDASVGFLPILALWFAAPTLAWWISQPIRVKVPDLTADQVGFLRVTARRTWHYFETFVTAEENWLPPDNFQETPVTATASRTSPTNIGLALLANLAARDLGYIPLGEMIQRTAATLGSLRRLERHRLHFYNWYDTRTLRPLLPLYVSSVDSGNLAGHLLTLAAGLREQADTSVFSSAILLGLGDTLRITRSLSVAHPAMDRLEELLQARPTTLAAAEELLSQATEHASALTAAAGLVPGEGLEWAQRLVRQCRDHHAELAALLPGLTQHRTDPMAWTAPKGSSSGAAEALPAAVSLRELTKGMPAGSAGSGQQFLDTLEALAVEAEDMAAMDFTFLFDATRDLFCIGYNVGERRADAGHYDLLGSEARLCSYVAIALGQIPQDHWFTLGRLLVASHRQPILVSWSGSMFEYLMPLLVMPTHEGTLLGQTCDGAVLRQIAYGKTRGVPWGISESGYNRTDAQLNYQYRAFGVPGLGLKRGLGDDLVVAPYATVLALMVSPRQACENLQRLAETGLSGQFGFYEAIDYTPSRLPPGENEAVIRSFMAHHQGMSLLALDNLLCNAAMQRRFMACPMLRAAELLLQERMPRTAATVLTESPSVLEPESGLRRNQAAMRVFTNPSLPAPEVHLLSNGRYHLMITSAGGGYSRWGGVAINRWREDATRDAWGMFVYLNEEASGESWCATFQPALHPTREYEAIFTQSRAEFRQHHAGIDLHTEISISPEDDIELRRMTLTNRTPVERVIELTSYFEIVIAAPESDITHPAFSNLFVQTEFIRDSSAILATRRARSAEERPPWLLHLLLAHEPHQGAVSCETDRARFLGRGRSLSNPLAMDSAGPLSDTAGAVLDPIASLRRRVTVPANGSLTVDMIVGIAADRESALALVGRYQGDRMADRALDLAWIHNQVTLQQLGITEVEAQTYGQLAGALVFADPVRRAAPAVLAANRRGQGGLWSHGISGDLPIVLLRITDGEKGSLVEQVIHAHAYWRTKGLEVDLIILIEDSSTYRQAIHDQISNLVSSGIAAQLLDKRGGIFVRRLDQIPAEDHLLFQAVARVVLTDTRGSLATQLEQRSHLESQVHAFRASRPRMDPVPVGLPEADLQFDNGLGGFSADGAEYVIRLSSGSVTPAPWVNVIANPGFGTVVSEMGAGYTWSENAHEFRMTPWSNDPLQDPPGEALYLRDEETGEYWSPTPQPATTPGACTVRHGFGYSVFERTAFGITSRLWIYVAHDAPVKFLVLTLHNVSGRARRLSVTGYWEWVLGELRNKGLLHIQTEIDPRTGALLATNRFNPAFADRVAFVDANDPAQSHTGDRKEFIGRNGSLAQPAAMKRTRLSGRVGCGLDPCGAVQVSFNLAVDQQRETSFRTGVGSSLSEVQSLIRRFRRPDANRVALEAVRAHWNRTLGAVRVETPDRSVDFLANGWLLYQTLGSRMWGRTGFYQSGGAYGFRDQLQDSLALLHSEPALTREHLLRAAAHQFDLGDVQHWWHPPIGRGVRTHFSDDYLWLPYVVCRYVSSLADSGVLDEVVPFLEGRPVRLDEESYYDLPGSSATSGTLYVHCVRAIERGLVFGSHGLPLIGGGDWNDGMNLVGHEGRGESVWLAFFLYDVLVRFAALAATRHDTAFAERCQTEAGNLKRNIESNAWDGDWYRRAYFDNGEPLGSHANEECRIDSIPQSWAVLSGAADPERARRALVAVNDQLVDRAAGLIRLFHPPFDKSSLEPGYIKGYIPGVRENGGQYTHGALWTVMALALSGEVERAWELFGLLNPIHHGDSPARIAIYRVEPYVVAADVYAVAPHVGRGGWTWYTGSAGWMYRLILETLLGLNREGNRLRLTPRLPLAWPSCRIIYRHQDTTYRIEIVRISPEDAGAVMPSSSGEPLGNGDEDVATPLKTGVASAGSARVATEDTLVLDGMTQTGNSFTLANDRQEHAVTLHLAARKVHSAPSRPAAP